MRLQRELFRLDRQHDPYRDWYAVYREEVTDKIKHWPSNRKMDMGSDEGLNLNENIQGVAQ
jgi:hypothetical protein